MINYPVKVVPYGDTYLIEDSNGYVFARVPVLLPSGDDSLVVAGTVANALNAMNEAPVPSLSITTFWQHGKFHGPYVDWYNKYLQENN